MLISLDEAGVVVPAGNPSTGEAEVGGPWVQGLCIVSSRSGLHGEALYQIISVSCIESHSLGCPASAPRVLTEEDADSSILF